MSMQSREDRAARDALLHSILAQMPTKQPGMTTADLSALAGDKDLKTTRYWLERMAGKGVIASKRPAMKNENLHTVTSDWAAKHMQMIAEREERLSSNGKKALTRFHKSGTKVNALLTAAIAAKPEFRTVWRGPVPEGYGVAA